MRALYLCHSVFLPADLFILFVFFFCWIFLIIFSGHLVSIPTISFFVFFKRHATKLTGNDVQFLWTITRELCVVAFVKSDKAKKGFIDRYYCFWFIIPISDCTISVSVWSRSFRIIVSIRIIVWSLWNFGTIVVVPSRTGNGKECLGMLILIKRQVLP